MKWYIIILTVDDYYKVYQGMKIIKALNSNDAIQQAKNLTGNKSYIDIETVIECKTKPHEL